MRRYMVLLAVLCVGALAVVGVLAHKETVLPESTAAPQTAVVSGGVVPVVPETASSPVVASSSVPEWRNWFPGTVPLVIGGVLVEASVAGTIAEQIAGLSNTPYLPRDVVKLFAFTDIGPQSMWMKDMRYSLDFLWLDAEGRVVHMESDVSPATYPASFSSPVPAQYVVEAAAGFIAQHGLVVGATTSVSTLF